MRNTQTMASLAVAALALALSAGPALAHSCPVLMKEVDALLAKEPQVTSAQLTEAKRLRQEGEELHKAGSHDASMDALQRARNILQSR